MSEREKLLRHVVLQVVRECPQCHHPFAGEDIRFLGQLDEAWLFSLYCHACHVLAIVGLAVAPVTPGREADAVPAQPITADDVLDMHMLLEQCPDVLRSLRAAGDGAE